VVSAADPLRSLISVFYNGAATFLSICSSFILTRAEWTPFQAHCYSENLVASGIEQYMYIERGSGPDSLTTGWDRGRVLGNTVMNLPVP
jgi:hypothetical protein